VRGTRIMPDAIVNSYEMGESIDGLHDGFLRKMRQPDLRHFPPRVKCA